MNEREIQIDGDRPVVLELETKAVMFLCQVLGSQQMASVTQAGQQGLLADISAQMARQHGLTGEPAVVPRGGPVPLPGNRAQRRAADRNAK